MSLRARAPRPRPAVRAAALAGAGALVLTGCEAPTPLVTVFTGTTSVNAHAVCWSFDEEPVDPSTCTPGDEVPSIEYQASETVGISVDVDVAEGGWIPYVATGAGAQEQPLVADPLESTYYRFALPELSAEQATVTLRVVAVTGEGEETGTRGAWLFTLRPAD
ncbi:hypothetical protein [Vallicoccus soli]|uniref:DUF2771 family protein n=1 Tax=Vallicoccus soli TaxID=2339232 RepID=A0A3A3Z791_9ACTN|nr:hypothetical protein [Vallicoccus soli]RJK97797.1 hypothetical protein D5H78_02070 [Vallicoccus soli]